MTRSYDSAELKQKLKMSCEDMVDELDLQYFSKTVGLELHRMSSNLNSQS